MRRGTTPTLTCTIDGADLTDSHVYMTIQQGGTEITIENPEIETTETGCKITVTLTQEQTLKLKAGVIDIQFRWITSDGTALATDVQQVEVYKILKQGAISYE